MTSQERKAAQERLNQIIAQNHKDIQLINAKISMGTRIIIDTAFGPHQIDGITLDFLYYAHPANQPKDWTNQRTFYGCNNGTWDIIKNQAGLN